MKILEIGPSETRSRGGMAEVIRGIRKSRILGQEFEIDSFSSYIDGSLPVRLLYSMYGYLRFLTCYRKYDLFHIHAAERGSTFRKNFYLRTIKRSGKKVIIHIHGAEYLTFYDGLNIRKKRIVDNFIRQADLVLALSDSWKQELESRFQMNACETLYNGVDPASLDSASSDPLEHQNTFLMLGRLGERKGIYDLIAAEDGRIQVVHLSQNQGPSAARNEGIRRARGDYISFVDADDSVEPELLEKLYKSLAEAGAEISICGADGIQLKSGSVKVCGQAEAVRCLARGYPFNLVPWAKLYKAELVKRNLFQEDIYYSEDLLFLYSVLKQARQVVYHPDVLYHYNQREGSQMQSGASERKLTAFAAQDFVCQDAALNFPETEADFRLLVLEANRCLAVLTVKKGRGSRQTVAYLRRIQENTRRHFSLSIMARCSRKRDVAALLALCASARGFWAAAKAFIWIKRLGGR